MDASAPKIRRAATVMVLRDAASLEVLLLRRSARSAFAPGAFVFPGGSVDRQDDGSLERAAVRELFEEARVRVDIGDLVRFSRWITPPGEARRFDTTFFAARAPDGQEAMADERETHDTRWIAPDAALREHAGGRLHLVYPTLKHLERIAAFASAGELLAYARTKAVVTVEPRASDGDAYVMPAELEGRW